MKNVHNLNTTDEYAIGDIVTTNTGARVQIPDSPLGEFMVASKRYANSIGCLSKTLFFLSQPEGTDPHTEFAIQKVEFVPFESLFPPEEGGEN